MVPSMVRTNMPDTALTVMTVTEPVHQHLKAQLDTVQTTQVPSGHSQTTYSNKVC